MIQIANVTLPLSQEPLDEPKALLLQTARLLRVPPNLISGLRIIKKSIDARKKQEVRLVYTICCCLPPQWEEKTLARQAPAVRPYLPEPPPPPLPQFHGAARPVVVGSGPAGLFAALTLAKADACPIILERGKPVEERLKDVEDFWRTGRLNPESNVQFGEGGAGTFSDGKLTTGTHSPLIRQVLQALVQAGAPEEILYAAKPHIGTDVLRPVVKRLREEIQSLGGTYLFTHKLSGLICRQGRLTGILVDTGRQTTEMAVSSLILAIGHSARDTFSMLHQAGLAMEAKPFSIGVRIEHPQALINQSQYGPFAGHSALGAADYKLSCHLPGGRSVYTFCMCPGGTVVAAASEPGGVVTNGMSDYGRAGKLANSALLVGVTPADFPSASPLAGIEFQQIYEQLAFSAGGKTYCAPAQRVGDFLSHHRTVSGTSLAASYAPGVVPADLRQCLPGFAADALAEALPIFDRKLRGFAHPDSVMTGVETRSSSPVRILRDVQLQSGIRGIYPCGEGAGYAGGIMSAAVDGIRCATELLVQQVAG